jgi:hypothetical protein
MRILITFLLLTALGTGCSQRQATPAQSSSTSSPLSRTAAGFRTITTNMTLQQVTDRFGMYDRVRGSGISYYEYDFPDGSVVLLSPEWPFRPTNRIQAVTFYNSTNEITLYP